MNHWLHRHDPKLRARARELRRNATLGEVLLWKKLRARQLGCQFHRQMPIDRYIVDFYCHELRLAIEIDGCSHDIEKVAYDTARQTHLEELGIRVLRFTESEVKENVDGIVDGLQKWIEDNGGKESPFPSRLQGVD